MISYKARYTPSRWPAVGQRQDAASNGQASLFGVFHSSALIGLTSAVVCMIQYFELASGRRETSVRERTLIGCSV